MVVTFGQTRFALKITGSKMKY